MVYDFEGDKTVILPLGAVGRSLGMRRSFYLNERQKDELNVALSVAPILIIICLVGTLISDEAADLWWSLFFLVVCLGVAAFFQGRLDVKSAPDGRLLKIDRPLSAKYYLTAGLMLSFAFI